MFASSTIQISTLLASARSVPGQLHRETKLSLLFHTLLLKYPLKLFENKAQKYLQPFFLFLKLVLLIFWTDSCHGLWYNNTCRIVISLKFPPL